MSFLMCPNGNLERMFWFLRKHILLEISKKCHILVEYVLSQNDGFEAL